MGAAWSHETCFFYFLSYTFVKAYRVLNIGHCARWNGYFLQFSFLSKTRTSSVHFFKAPIITEITFRPFQFQSLFYPNFVFPQKMSFYRRVNLEANVGCICSIISWKKEFQRNRKFVPLHLIFRISKKEANELSKIPCSAGKSAIWTDNRKKPTNVLLLP